MKRIPYANAAVLSLGLAYGATAQAVTFVTPAAFVTQQQAVSCIATNFDGRPANILVQQFDRNGAPIAPSFDNCNGRPLASGHSCSFSTPRAVAFGESKLCRVESSSPRVKVALEVFAPGTGGLRVMFPATRP